MAISNATVVPIVIAARLVARYQKKRVYAQRTNPAWRDSLNGGGDTTRLSQIDKVAISDYDAETALTYADADVTALGDLQPNKKKKWTVKLDDIPAIQATPAVLEEAVADAGEELAFQVDTDIRDSMISGATEGIGGAAGISLAHNAASPDVADLAFPSMHRQLDMANIPTEGRFCIIDPFTLEWLRNVAVSNEVIVSEMNNLGDVVNGNVGRFAGFDIYVTPNAVTTAYDSDNDTATGTAIYGVDRATAFVDQVDRVESLRLESQFGDAVRGLYTYGAKVILPDAIYKTLYKHTHIP